ncbi:hypothetical protein KY338_00435 [Candidatus Woesearchaeota archaeon]|nr:hypothetical protein [Candidatus Woesearchaeota archaeon]MBW3005213.1 hypothetical protein [Candidatus Woesearchaeota archaeon]
MKLAKITFWALIVLGLIIFASIFTGIIGKIPFLPAIGLFFLLGVLLVIFTLKEKVKGWLKFFLLLTGISSSCFVLFVVFHNFFYALNIIWADIAVLRYLTEWLHVGYFLIGVLVCPVTFLIGLIGSIVLFLKKNSFIS